jgi:predicted alpha/beta hydrolase
MAGKNIVLNHKEVTFYNSRNEKLRGTVFLPSSAKGAVLIGPATGISRFFYQKFAMYLAEQGLGVLTFDHAGIGDSCVGSVSKSKASLVSWGRSDMTAALETLQSHFPETSYHLLGHSSGGQLAGLMKNSHELASMFTVASSSGNLKKMKSPFKYKAWFYMNIFIPVSNRLFGHTKSQWVSMGHPLPSKVARQWSRWCNGEGYIKTDFGKKIGSHFYDTLTIPSKWVFAVDDEIATLENVKEMAAVYTRLETEIEALEPNEWNYPDIGHMKFFSSKRKKLWNLALEWFYKHK